MWTKFVNWLKGLFGLDEKDEVPFDEDMIPVTVAEEAVRVALEEPTSEDLAPAATTEDPKLTDYELDEQGRCIIWIKNSRGQGVAHRFETIAEALLFSTANPEPSLSPDKLWRGLKDRPAEDDPNWTEYDRHFITFGYGGGSPWVRHKVWIDPITNRIEWHDGPNQYGTGKFGGSTGPGYYWIGKGYQDLGAQPASFKWTGSDARITLSGDDLIIARIKSYTGKTPSDLANWPSEYKKAYRDTHAS